VAIGARLNDGNGTNSGHTRIYEYDAKTTSWTQLGSDIDGEAAGDQSGFSVSLSADGRRVAIGAHLNDDNGSRSGHTRIYEYNSSTASWTQLDRDIDGEAAGDNSGRSVSLSADGRRAAIGAPLNFGSGMINSGHARVFELAAATSHLDDDKASPTPAVQVIAHGRELRLQGAAHLGGQATQVRLFDLAGREVLHTPVSAHETIPLGMLPKGIYLYRLEGPDLQQAGKVVVR
jgi:hypothetical protein